MLNLRSLEGKNIRLTDIEEEVFVGYVADYVFAEDNVPEEVEAIILDYPVRQSDGYKYKNPVEFIAPDIKSVEVIK